MKTKQIFFSVLLLAAFSTNTYAQLDIKEDIIGTSNEAETVLTKAELLAQRNTFLSFITRYKSDAFVGFAQYSLSAVNLSLKTHVKYTKELNGSISFQMASNGNQHVSYGDVTFPMQAKVYFELKDAQTNEFLSFTDGSNGQTVIFEGKRNTLYLVETEEGYKRRRDVQAKFMKAGQTVGRFFAKVKYDMFTQDVEFYEIDSSLGENVLMRRGHFKGNVSPSRTGF